MMNEFSNNDNDNDNDIDGDGDVDDDDIDNFDFSIEPPADPTLRHRFKVRKFCSILDRESTFPVHIQLRMRTRIKEFALVQDVVLDYHHCNKQKEEEEEEENVKDVEDVENEAYELAVRTLRSTIAKNDHDYCNPYSVSSFPPFVRHLVREKIGSFIREFLNKTENETRIWLYQKLNNPDNANGEHFDTTVEGIKTAVHFFPKVLLNDNDSIYSWTQERHTQHAVNAAASKHYPYDESDDFYRKADAILNCDTNSISFVPVLAQLGMKYKLLFSAKERGGLLTKHYNMLRFLALSPTTFFAALRGGRVLVDEQCLGVIQQLRSMGLFKKEDIREYGLLQYCYKQ